MNIPIPTKIGSKMGGEFTYQPKWDPKTVLTHSHPMAVQVSTSCRWRWDPRPPKRPSCTWTAFGSGGSAPDKTRASCTGLPIFPLKPSPPPRDTHLSWAKKVMFKTAKMGNIGTPVLAIPCSKAPSGLKRAPNCTLDFVVATDPLAQATP